MKQLSGCHFKHLWKKTEYYCKISVWSINGEPKTLDDLGFFCIANYSGMHYHGLALYAEYFTTSGSEG
jgi:hypothetical protein